MTRLSDIIPQADIDGYLEGDDEVVKAKVELALEGVAYAKSIAPVAEVDGGYYRDHIMVVRKGGTGVYVGFTDPKSHIIEYGAEHKPAFHIRASVESHFEGENTA